MSSVGLRENCRLSTSQRVFELIDRTLHIIDDDDVLFQSHSTQHLEQHLQFREDIDSGEKQEVTTPNHFVDRGGRRIGFQCDLALLPVFVAETFEFCFDQAGFDVVCPPCVARGEERSGSGSLPALERTSVAHEHVPALAQAAG